MYDGNAKTPTVTVDGLQKGKNFTVTYDNNIEVGRATAVVKGIGAYTGSYIKSFTITASELMRENQVYNLLNGETNLRIYGLDRYETSLKTADALKSSLGVSAFENIIVADGRAYADALAGTYLAKVKDAPILVVGADEQSQSKVLAYIKSNLKASGTVYILGGTGAVSSAFETAIKSVTKNVKRLAGDNRYATNIAILKESGVDSEEILVCSGLNFADSLSASAVGMPILLVGTELTTTQLAYLKSLDSNKYYIIGGTGAVSEKVKSQLSRWSTERIYGSNRYETSVAVAKAFFDDKTKSVVLAYGLNFPDGLSGGPLAMSIGAPLILSTTSNTSAAESYVTQIDLKGVVVLGGVSLISNAAVQSISK
jgi:putative cell wall-binding protein